MKKIYFWLIGIGVVILVLGGFLYYRYQKNKNNSSPTQSQTATTVNTNSSNKKTTSATDQKAANSSNTNQPTDNQNSNSTSSKNVLTEFLKTIVSSGDKSKIVSYSSSQFYNSDFIQGIVNDSSLGPDAAAIVSQGDKNSTGFIFQVNESYNISNNNNAGNNGTYYYALTQIDNQWLVDYRGENKPN